jgi:REP element-mobilizing transposase RayT
MARPLRIKYEEAIYHVTARGNERGKIFFSKRDYEKFKEYLTAAKEKYGLILHSYVLMTNHYHLLCELTEPTLSLAAHWLNGSHSVWFNRRHQRSGVRMIRMVENRFAAV